MTTDWIEKLFANPDMLTMGHGQRKEDLNLGLGWLYYGLVRAMRPRQAVCIGSWRGFVPITIGQAMKDNNEGGQVLFIDPSLVDEQWADADRTRAWFAGYGLDNIRHVRMTTQTFVDSTEYQALGPVDLLFVDGFHSAEQARFDHEAFVGLLSADAMVLFHDSVRRMTSRIYGEARPYEHTVVDYIEQLKSRHDLQVMDFHLDSGVTLVRQANHPSSSHPV